MKVANGVFIAFSCHFASQAAVLFAVAGDDDDEPQRSPQAVGFSVGWGFGCMELSLVMQPWWAGASLAGPGELNWMRWSNTASGRGEWRRLCAWCDPPVAQFIGVQREKRSHAAR
jgi:hypothetical protein